MKTKFTYRLLAIMTLFQASLFLACGQEQDSDQRGYVAYQAQEANSHQGNAVVHCSFQIDGQSYEGKSQAECDKLKEELGIDFKLPNTPSPKPVQEKEESNVVHCAFNVNGELYEGKSQAECDQLKKDLGIELPPLPNPPSTPPSQPTPPPPPPSQPNDPGQGDVVVRCAFNINGVLYEGNSQAECDKLRQDLGL
jgi:hypothetical protein